MEVKKGYRHTEIGVIPNDWEVYPFGKLLKVRHGRSQHDVKDENGEYPILASGGVIGKAKKFLYNKPSVLIGRKGTIDEPQYIETPFWSIDTLFYTEISSKADPKFIFYKFNKVDWYSFNEASGVPSLNSGTIEKILVSIPPTKSEQSAIATVLSETDSLIINLEKLLAKKEAVKKGTMQVLFTGKKRLPGFNGKWRKKKINKLFKFLSTANNSRSELSDDGEIGYIHYGDIHTKWSEFLDASTESIPFIKVEKIKDVPFLENGDLLIADASEDYAGLCACIELANVEHRKIVGGLHTLLLRGNKEEIADGFKGYLPHLKGFKEAIIRAATGISVYGISKRNLGEIEITIPDTIEQSAIAAVIADMDTEIRQLEAKLQKYKMIKQSMMQNLLTGKIRLV